MRKTNTLIFCLIVYDARVCQVCFHKKPRTVYVRQIDIIFKSTFTSASSGERAMEKSELATSSTQSTSMSA